MSYESNTWSTGDVISAEKLNKIERGIEAGDNSVLARVAFTGDYNDLLNKLVWVEADTTEATLIDNKAFDVVNVTDMSTATGKESFSGWYAVSIVLDYNDLFVGDTLNITIDDAVYNSVVTFGEDDEDEMVFAGANLSEFETAESIEDLSYPFTLSCHLDDTISSNRSLSLSLYTQDSAKASVTISLTNFHMDYVIHKLPSEYVDGHFIVPGENDGDEVFNDVMHNIANGFLSHAEGISTTASGYGAHAEGNDTNAIGYYSHAEGYRTTAGTSDDSTNIAAHAEGQSTTASGPNSHSEGQDTRALGRYSHAEGYQTEVGANANGGHAEGMGTKANGAGSHAEGNYTIASGTYSHAEGNGGVTASGNYSHAEGSSGVTASGEASHAEGTNGTKAKGNASHAEGTNTEASEGSAHSEGFGTKAKGAYSHSEGGYAEASGTASHAEGYYSKASGEYSHAEGYYTIAAKANQHVQGKYNVEDTNGTYAHIVGGGTSDNARANIHTLDWNGNAYYKGSLTLDNVTITPQQLSSLLALLNA